jgi:Fic-DOC domain mobile mystery protein B
VTADLTGEAEGQTPLDDDELRGLRLTYVTTRGELDAAEQLNIVDGRAWATGRTRTIDQILDDVFLRRLHREMFGDVWRWAGKYRRSNKNIGVDWLQVGEAVRNLCADARMWHAAAEGNAAQDTASVTFHQRLVLIHPFVNGNGRHARLTADLLAAAIGSSAFTWGGTMGAVSTAEGDPVRAAYLDALRKADNGDLAPLVAFARS